MATTGKNGPQKPKARRKTAAANPNKRVRKRKATLVQEAQILDEAHFFDEAQVVAETAVADTPPPAPAPVEAPKPAMALIHVAPPPVEISHRPVWLAIGAAAFVAVGALVAQRVRPHAPPPPAPPRLVSVARPPLVAPPASPSTAELQRALGHKLFVEGRRKEALRAYERALASDFKIADAQLIDDLVMCYGRKDSQPDAAALIVRFRLSGAAEGLKALRSRGSRGTRRGAYYTLQRLDELSQRDRRRG